MDGGTHSKLRALNELKEKARENKNKVARAAASAQANMLANMFENVSIAVKAAQESVDAAKEAKHAQKAVEKAEKIVAKDRKSVASIVSLDHKRRSDRIAKKVRIDRFEQMSRNKPALAPVQVHIATHVKKTPIHRIRKVVTVTKPRVEITPLEVQHIDNVLRDIVQFNNITSLRNYYHNHFNSENGTFKGYRGIAKCLGVVFARYKTEEDVPALKSSIVTCLRSLQQKHDAPGPYAPPASAQAPAPVPAAAPAPGTFDKVLNGLSGFKLGGKKHKKHA
jgi:hypothetical protein